MNLLTEARLHLFFFNGSKSRIVLAANLEFQYYFVAIHIHVYRQECKIVLEVG